jgi:hypothetical protein
MTTKTTTRQRAYDRFDYATKIRVHVLTDDWRDAPGYEGQGWDIDRANGGTLRLFVEDAEAEAVKVWLFTPSPARLIDGEMEFVGISPRLVANAILEALR